MSLTLILATLFAIAHPNSLSSSLVTVGERDAHVLMRCQVASLLEVLPDLDANGDESVSATELESGKEDVFEYLSTHYVLHTGTNRQFEGGERLTPELLSVAITREEERPFDPVQYGQYKDWVDIEMRWSANQDVTDLMFECALFFDTSPDHYDLTLVTWSDGATDTIVLDRFHPRGRTDPEGSGAFAAFFRLGWEHILGGWDHLAFLAALIFATRKLSTLLGVVTAFTLAHSITLACATLGLVDVSSWSHLVEAAIALSIAYVATDHLLHPDLQRSRFLEAFTFGLIHGLGFAGFLAESLVHERAVAMALFSFNVGVEAGQILVVVLLALLLRLIPRRTQEEDPYIAPLRVRQFGCAVVAICGFYWFFERVL